MFMLSIKTETLLNGGVRVIKELFSSFSFKN